MNFKINSRPLFTIIFKLKNDNFKTRDFSPLIERVLAGVPSVYPAFPVPAALSCQKEDDFLKYSFQQTHLIFHLHFANGKCYQVDFFCLFLSFGPLNLMLCILDCCYWWKHQTLVEYFSFPNKRVGWNKRNGGKKIIIFKDKKSC